MTNNTSPATYHDVPRCNCCGHIGPWEIEPVLTSKHWIIGIGLMLLGFAPGVIYLITAAIIRSGSKNRTKICAKCKAQNMFTFQY